MDELQSAGKRMKLRYRGCCRVCQADLPAGIEAIYERSTKTVRCTVHDHSETDAVPKSLLDARTTAPSPTDAGVPGASARREFERRAQGRERRIRGKHPKLGGVILALSDEPQSTSAWDTGAVGEERLGSRLNEIRGDSLLVLHDRRIPRTRGNIDHIVVTPSGIWVIDAKRYRGRPSLKVEGGLLRQRTEKLLIGTRDSTKLVDGVLKQIEVVEDVLLPGGRPEGPGRPWGRVPVRGVLCFVDADWPLLARPFHTRGVDVLWPKRLYARLQENGPLTPEAIAEMHRHLAAAMPPA